MSFPFFGVPGIIGEVLGGLSGFTLVGSNSFSSQSSSGTVNSIELPDDIQEGDFLAIVAVAYARDFSFSIPSGWTSKINRTTWTFIAQDSAELRVYTKIAVGNEGGDEIAVPLNTSGSPEEDIKNNAAVALVFRGTRPIVSVGAAQGEVFPGMTSGNPSATTISSGAGAGPLIAFGLFGAQGTFSPTMSPKDGQLRLGSAQEYVTWKFMQDPANVTIDMPDASGASQLGGFYLELGI